MSSKKKKMLYVGGIDSSVNEEILFAAFIPFGNIRFMCTLKFADI